MPGLFHANSDSNTFSYLTNIYANRDVYTNMDLCGADSNTDAGVYPYTNTHSYVHANSNTGALCNTNNHSAGYFRTNIHTCTTDIRAAGNVSSRGAAS